MNTTIEVTAALSFEDRELYKQHLRIINKIVCSYSRYEAFVAAIDQIGAAEKYSVVAEMYCLHNVMFHFDEEGVMNTYYLTDEVIK